MTGPVADADHAGIIAEVRINLARANRILAHQGVVDTFGHVSQRSPIRPDRLFISRSIAPERVKPSDIIEIDLNGDAIDPTAPSSYIERFIHTELYRSRPEVGAVVHSHSPSVLPFAVVAEARLRCVCHTAGFIGHDVPLFEIRETSGDNTDLLVSTPDLGIALAACLGDQSIVLMRGHGSTVVGTSLRQAVFRAVYAEVNAQVQFKSLQLGAVTYLSPGEASIATSSDIAFDRAWDLWTHQISLTTQGDADFQSTASR